MNKLSCQKSSNSIVSWTKQAQLIWNAPYICKFVLFDFGHPWKHVILVRFVLATSNDCLLRVFGRFPSRNCLIAVIRYVATDLRLITNAASFAIIMNNKNSRKLELLAYCLPRRRQILCLRNCKSDVIC